MDEKTAKAKQARYLRELAKFYNDAIQRSDAAALEMDQRKTKLDTAHAEMQKENYKWLANMGDGATLAKLSAEQKRQSNELRQRKDAILHRLTNLHND